MVIGMISLFASFFLTHTTKFVPKWSRLGGSMDDLVVLDIASYASGAHPLFSQADNPRTRALISAGQLSDAPHLLGNLHTYHALVTCV